MSPLSQTRPLLEDGAYGSGRVGILVSDPGMRALCSPCPDRATPGNLQPTGALQDMSHLGASPERRGGGAASPTSPSGPEWVLRLKLRRFLHQEQDIPCEENLHPSM